MAQELHEISETALTNALVEALLGTVQNCIHTGDFGNALAGLRLVLARHPTTFPQVRTVAHDLEVYCSAAAKKPAALDDITQTLGAILNQMGQQENDPALDFATDKSGPVLWEWAREAILTVVNRMVPVEAPHFEAVWTLMDMRGLLGHYHPPTLDPDPQIGFVPATAEGAKLPILVGILTNIVQDATQQDMPPDELVRQQLTVQEEALRQIAGFSTEEIDTIRKDALSILAQLAPSGSP